MARRYQESDYKEVSGWFHSRNIEITEEYLPHVGYIEPGVAAGFIYQTDANFCIFESFIGNPEKTHQERKSGLEKIVEKMILMAKHMQFKYAYGFATSKTMIDIGAEQGFKFIETCSTIQKEL